MQTAKRIFGPPAGPCYDEGMHFCTAAILEDDENMHQRGSSTKFKEIDAPETGEEHGLQTQNMEQKARTVHSRARQHCRSGLAKCSALSGTDDDEQNGLDAKCTAFEYEHVNADEDYTCSCSDLAVARSLYASMHPVVSTIDTKFCNVDYVDTSEVTSPSPCSPTTDVYLLLDHVEYAEWNAVP